MKPGEVWLLAPALCCKGRNSRTISYWIAIRIGGSTVRTALNLNFSLQMGQCSWVKLSSVTKLASQSQRKAPRICSMSIIVWLIKSILLKSKAGSEMQLNKVACSYCPTSLEGNLHQPTWATLQDHVTDES